MVLKLTVWKDTPDAYLYDGPKRGTKTYNGPNINNLQGKDYEAVPVETIQVKRRNIEIFLVNNCTLESEKQVEVLAETSGIVQNILVEEGDHVRSGMPLAKLDEEEVLLALREAKLKKENAERVYRSSLDNFKENIISKEEFEEKKFQLEIATVELERKQMEYEYTTIKSPIDGIIVERNIEEGYDIEKGRMVFKIADFDPILARIYIPEKDVNKVVEGQMARVVYEFLTGIEFTGRVKMVSPVVDPESGTVKVTIEINDQSGGALKPGMFVSVFTIVGQHQNALLIPKKALILEAEADEVFVVREFIVLSISSDKIKKLAMGDSVVCEQRSTINEESRKGLSLSGKVVDISGNHENGAIYNITIEATDILSRNINKEFEKVSFYNDRGDLLLSKNNVNFHVKSRAFKTKITPGFKEGNYVEILTGLKESDRVITVGQDDVGHGADVVIINEEKEAGETAVLGAP
ncbi:efflux transporter, RND family, MFP subunit [Candidatus Scalindua japonica]|uniref:Efflux transporter, RND family, MFP subunit n=2 Tax=Candidatus Scalindua japonica TaxID=1284222 RepID=A0A286TYB6_9BACT|nr:efflux transporter, RND family, MFP subunit [Candidatus Scalindua japonica]